MLVRLLCLTVVAALLAVAQFATFPDAAYFREQWQASPLDIEIDSVGGLDDFYFDGKIELSLRSYIELVMVNSPDINLQKLAVFEQQNAIQRAFSPFDPTLNLGFTTNRSTTLPNDILEGADVRTNLNQRGNFTYSQTFDTGTNYTVGYIGSKSANNSQFTNFNPSITQNLLFTVSQPLLRDRGRFVQRIPIFIAKSRLKLTEEQVRGRVIGLLVQAENAYWDVIDQRESLRVRENNLGLARAFLERSRRELELGAISPLDIYQPEQQFATAQVGVTQFQYRLQQAEDTIRRWIGADLHPTLRHAPLVLTETADPPVYYPSFGPEEQVSKALRLRPELGQDRRALEIDDLNIRASTNQMRPDLMLNANYSAQGRGGNFFERSLLGSASTSTVIPGGFPDALDQLFQFRFPTYGFGFSLQIPIRDRRSAADLADARIQKRRDLYTLRSSEQQVREEVLNAVAGVEQSKAGILQATVARDFAQKRLDAEQKKYDLGVTTAFLVLDSQTRLVDAEADLLAQVIAYRRSMLNLLQSTGDLLETRGVVLRYDTRSQAHQAGASVPTPQSWTKPLLKLVLS